MRGYEIMKNKFKKIITVALSIICLLANNQSNAMDKSISDNFEIYISKLKSFYDIHGEEWCYTYSKHKETPKVLKETAQRLDLQYSSDKMFPCDGVIKHRPLIHDKLVLGCGNAVDLFGVKPMPPFWSKEKMEECRLAHLHEGYDTIDLNFEMNPNIVMKIGDPNIDINQIFEGRKYKEVCFEGGPEFGSWFLEDQTSLTCLGLGENFISTFKKHLLEITMDGSEIYELNNLTEPETLESPIMPKTKVLAYTRKRGVFCRSDK